jgi:hypothetical protein
MVQRQASANSDATVKACLRALLEPNEWVHRRKASAELLTFRLARRRLTVDLCIPEFATEEEGGWVVPIALLRKAPGAFTRFDFASDLDGSLRLPSRQANAQLSAAMLIEQARAVLGSDAVDSDLALRTELDYIASADLDDALAIVRYRWRPRRKEPLDDPRSRLVADADFWWLLRALAMSSLVTARLSGSPGTRHMVKLTYDELPEDRSEFPSSGLARGLRAARNLIGWRGPIAIATDPYVGGGTYHFELHAPDGAQIVQASFAGREPESQDRERVHLYIRDARSVRAVTALVQLRIRGQAFVMSATLTSLFVALVATGCLILYSDLAEGVGSASSLLLVFPGLAASYVARPEHSLVSRQLVLARAVLIASAVVAYVVAARLALITSDHGADPDHLRHFLIGTTVAAWCFCAMLAVINLLPRPLGRVPRT